LKVAVLHQAVSEGASAADLDVLVQSEAVAAALRGRGHDVVVLPVSLDLAALRASLVAVAPDVAFNLVEALGGTDRLMVLAPLLLEAMAIPYTGASPCTLFAVNDKIAAKRAMRAAGIPTPPWWTHHGFKGGDIPPRAIVKAVNEHASIGLSDDSVIVYETPEQLHAVIHAAERRTGHAHFAEAYVEGREFNLSVLLGERPMVLPPAEIEFAAFQPGKPRIVGHAAKWDEHSFEYHHTPRSFTFPPSDAALLDRLRHLALRACEVFGVQGYARVDFRVDAAGEPWILEVNANPCLAPDAGFAAALARADIPYDEAIEGIVLAALRRRTKEMNHA